MFRFVRPSVPTAVIKACQSCEQKFEMFILLYDPTLKKLKHFSCSSTVYRISKITSQNHHKVSPPVILFQSFVHRDQRTTLKGQRYEKSIRCCVRAKLWSANWFEIFSILHQRYNFSKWSPQQKNPVYELATVCSATHANWSPSRAHCL